jgi:hypothetical protein
MKKVNRAQKHPERLEHLVTWQRTVGNYGLRYKSHQWKKVEQLTKMCLHGTITCCQKLLELDEAIAAAIFSCLMNCSRRLRRLTSHLYLDLADVLI